jgi:hypothetical protein
MARLKEIKEKYSNWDISIIDILSELDTTGTNKYTELFLKSIQNEHNYLYKNEVNIDSDWYLNKLNEWFDLELNSENNINDGELQFIKFKLLNTFINEANFLKIKKFIDYSERKLIKTDVNQIKTIEDIDRLICISDFKNIDKELSKDVLIEFKDENWLLIRPLTYESSLKYGASTKWCTASKDTYDHFFRYTESGVLIYCIDLKRGDKFGFHRDIPQSDNRHNNEISFWNTADYRVDSMQCNFSPDVINHLMNIELKSNKEMSNGKWEESLINLEEGLGIHRKRRTEDSETMPLLAEI